MCVCVCVCVCVFKQDLALNNLQELVSRKTKQPNQLPKRAITESIMLQNK